MDEYQHFVTQEDNDYENGQWIDGVKLITFPFFRTSPTRSLRFACTASSLQRNLTLFDYLAVLIYNALCPIPPLLPKLWRLFGPLNIFCTKHCLASGTKCQRVWLYNIVEVLALQNLRRLSPQRHVCPSSQF